MSTGEKRAVKYVGNRMKTTLLSATLLCALLACGDDKPTEPEPPDNALVGNWRFSGSELPQASADRFLENLRVLGIDSSTAVTLVSEFKASIDRGTQDSGFSVWRINADGTWSDNDGGSGTYTVAGDRLTVSSTDNPTLSGRYFVTDTALTFDVAILELLKQLEDIDIDSPVEERQFNILFGGVNTRLIFQKI